MAVPSIRSAILTGDNFPAFDYVQDPSDIVDYLVDVRPLLAGQNPQTITVTLDAAALALGVSVGTGSRAPSHNNGFITFWLQCSDATNAAFTTGIEAIATISFVTSGNPTHTIERSVRIIFRQSDKPPLQDVPLMSLTEAKAWLRVQDTEDDLIISSLLATIAERIESYCSAVTGGQRSIDLFFPSFARVKIYPTPLITVDSVSYYDKDGALQTLAGTEWQVGISYGVPTLLAAAGKSPPETAHRDDAVTVTVTAGWESRTDVPEKIKQAARIMLSHYYDNRELSAPMSDAIAELLSGFRNRLVLT
jgi:uncharacterized phiE125 gp8 family phage protein